jgi:hypothetical protein
MTGLRKFVLAALALTSLPALALAQQGSTISGRVTAEGGQPLVGATASRFRRLEQTAKPEESQLGE